MTRGQVSDKICLVTGAGSGIGRATAELMAAEGATAIIADIDIDAAKSVAESLANKGYRAVALELDVAEESGWRTTIDNILSDHQRMDVLVNSAGIALTNQVLDSSLDEWREVMRVNLDGVFMGTHYAISAMKDGGSIVNIASVAGINPFTGAAAYCSSKAAVRMFSRVAAIECADRDSGIRINTVSPGGVKTAIWETQAFFQSLVEEHGSTEAAFEALEGTVLSRRFFSPEAVAETILYLASDAASHVTGAEIVLDRGHTA